MYENEEHIQKILLLGADTGLYDIEVSLNELEELTNTAGGEVVGKITQKRPTPDNATYLGSGILEQAAEFCKNYEVDLAIFDDELTASQIRNSEKILDCPVIDRTMLILDIFAQRANTSEGRLQVELAQQKYLLPRLMGIGNDLSRLGGGIGTRGPGESKLESDRRHIRRRIQALEEQLDKLENKRKLLRTRRKKDGVTTVAIVGYTNVGKSTLLNALTDAGVLAENKLFATLDPTSRALELPSGRTVILIDTVGLIRRLPHHLVEAFKSTLEEAANADLVLNVCDASNDDMPEQIAVTKELMVSLGAEAVPILTVMNKCDMLNEVPVGFDSNTVLISARTGYGFDDLLKTIEKSLEPTQKRLMLLIPYTNSTLLNEIRIDGKIFSEEYTADGTLIDALVDIKIIYKVKDFISSR